MQFPPSTWEEKTVEMLEHAIRAPHLSKSKSQHASASQHRRRRPTRRAQIVTAEAPSVSASSSSSSSSYPSSSSSSTLVVSSPSLPAQPKTIIVQSSAPATTSSSAAARPAVAHSYTVRPLTSPALPRPVTWADEYYSIGPYSTSSSAYGAHLHLRQQPPPLQPHLRTAGNAKNASSLSLLHHHDYDLRQLRTAAGDRVLVESSSRNRPLHQHWEEAKEQPAAARQRDEAVQVQPLQDDAAASAGRVEESKESQSQQRWRYANEKGSDIIINVTCQHPQPPLSQPLSPPLAQPAPAAVPTRSTSRFPTPPPTAPPSAPPQPAAAGVPRSSFYSTAPARSHPLHASYSHPHPVYPAWWPTEQERLLEEREEHRKADEERERERRRAELRRAENARVRPVADHTCPPPAARAREGVTDRERREERKERRRREEEQRHRQQRVSTGYPLLRAEDDVDILTPQLSPSSSFASHARVRRPSTASAASAAHRPPVVQSRIKPLLDRDRRENVGSSWATMGTAEPLISRPAAGQRQQPPLPAAGAGESVNFATMLRQLAADPIVSSFAASAAPAASPRAQSLAAAASVSTATASAVLEELEGKHERKQDVEAARREFDKAEGAAGGEAAGAAGGRGGGGRGAGRAGSDQQQTTLTACTLSSAPACPSPLLHPRRHPALLQPRTARTTNGQS